MLMLMFARNAPKRLELVEPEKSDKSRSHQECEVPQGGDSDPAQSIDGTYTETHLLRKELEDARSETTELKSKISTLESNHAETKYLDDTIQGVNHKSGATATESEQIKKLNDNILELKRDLEMREPLCELAATVIFDKRAKRALAKGLNYGDTILDCSGSHTTAQQLINLRNAAVHHGDVLVEHALFEIGILKLGRVDLHLDLYGIQLGTLFPSDNFERVINMRGTMAYCNAWTDTTHSKRDEERFQALFLELLKYRDESLEKCNHVVSEAADYYDYRFVSQHWNTVKEMKPIGDMFVQKERDRQRKSQRQSPSARRLLEAAAREFFATALQGDTP